MDDVIYIIIGVFWLIYAIYKGNQKLQTVKKPPAAVERTDTTKNSFSEPLTQQQFFFEPFSPEPEAQEENIPEPTITYDELTLQQQSKIFTYDSLAKEEINQQQQGKKEEKTEIREHQQTNANTDFDAVKAVIYSEILKRNY
ncbi:MAG: hypothetical protein M0R21_03845 [Lentimicrobiaceae bacterium]|nr:hypothetical protein [Lentimicrobiaceae bacterium]